jgi:hypothetical protein
MWRQSPCLLTGLIVSVLCSGCGSSGGVPELGKVSGTVTQGGKPVSGAMVLFEVTGGRPSNGLTDAEGKFSLHYNAENPGAVTGEHLVRIELRPDVQNLPDNVPPPPSRLVEWPDKVQVKPGTNEFAFDITRLTPM